VGFGYNIFRRIAGNTELFDIAAHVGSMRMPHRYSHCLETPRFSISNQFCSFTDSS